ncbi:hypothetical protein BGX34_008034 [Mortierella sp. NVP85]|nr:hypothetical protein BGX34_008034 [Mortierella sp. NVP85]
MSNGNTVLFLTDENFKYLIPPRIAHQPGVVLDVIVTDGNQGDSSSLGAAIDNIQLVKELSAVTNSSTEATSSTRDVVSLRIKDSNDSEAPVVSSDHTLELALQPLSTSSGNQFQLEAENSMTQETRLRQLHLRVDALFGRIQQSEQKAQQTQQQMDEALGREQQTDQQMKEILEKIQEIDRQLEEAQSTQLQVQQLQKAQQQQQQMNDKLETALRTLQQLDQKTQVPQQHMQDKQDQQKQLNKALERIQQMDEQIHDMERLLFTQKRQKTLQAFHYFAFVQCRAQALLATSYKELSIPRLFIVLLEPTDAIDGQGRACLLQFRLRFLCECDAHKMTKNANGLHKVHLVDHPGYELVNQDEFINKYGSYLLTILYTVKYGTNAGGLAVLPLLGLKDATEDEEDEVHLQSVKKNFSSLVDDTITYLEGAIDITDKSPKTSAHPGLDLLELGQLRTYLKVKDGESSIGYLRPVTTQEGYCAWVCFDHILEHYEPAFQRLKYTLSASGGVCDNNQIQLKITSATKAKQLYDAIGNARFVQSIGDWQPLTYLGLEVSAHSSTTKPVPDIDSALKSLQKLMQDVHGPAANGINGDTSLSDLEQISLDFGRLSMVANGISRGVIGDVTMEVPRLSDLTPDDLEFIRQCQPVLLKILRASQEKDEARLVNILQHSTNLRELRIGCSNKRSFKLINSILSTRVKTIQTRGLSALRTLEVTREGLTTPTQAPEPCSCDQYTVAVTASFSEVSHLFEMHVNLSPGQLDPDDTAVCNFLRHYGWAIKTLGAPYLFGDHHAKHLDESTQKHGSMIEHLEIAPISLTETGLDAMDRVVKRSQNFISMRLTLNKLEENDQIEKALIVMKRYKDRLKSLRLTGDDTGWLIRVAKAFPAKKDLPVLESLCGEYGEPGKENNPSFMEWVKGAPQPFRAFCSALIGKVGDKGLLHQWAYNC